MFPVVDLCEDPIEVIVDDDNESATYYEIFKKNNLLHEFIEKCLDVEDSRGMSRIINNMLIPAYNALDKEYSKSHKFKKVLQRYLQLIVIDPFHKFTHIRDLYEVLKLHKARKKVKFVTLETNIQENKNINNALKRKTDSHSNLLKKTKIDIIDLEDNENIPADNYEYDVVVLDDKISIIDEEKEKDIENGQIHKKIEESNLLKSKCDVIIHKELSCDTTVINRNNVIINEINRLSDSNNTNQVNGELFVHLLSNSDNKQCNIDPAYNKSSNEINVACEIESANNDCELLVPKTIEPYKNDNNLPLTETIQLLETEIAKYEQKIQKLEQREVTIDSKASPYLISQKYKAKVVLLYKELCNLMGTESFKHRAITLKVTNGRPAGPVRRLEKILNKKLESNGELVFPDFHDVVKCVINSNIEDCLGWSMPQIMKEATILFTQCGRALQQRRQRKEWRDLMRTVRLKNCDFDPADADPELEARLQENKRIAKRKESEILEKYSMMQHSHSEQSEISNQSTNKILDEKKSDDSNFDSNSESESDIEFDLSKADCNLYSNGVEEIDNESKANNIHTKIMANRNLSELIGDETSQLSKEPSHVVSNERVIIKKEPEEELSKLLEALGNNYTVTIQDIYDPSLVIEISDSSSDEE